MTFEEMFRAATVIESMERGVKPYPYQIQFASEDELPALLNVPTGAGKTATAILGWLYCLPMRTLVEQTNQCAEKWLRQLGILAETHGDPTPLSGWSKLAANRDQSKRVAISVLMGGEEYEDWHLFPECDAILIGTQDMLLSRALNRGYGASRFHWPIDFGLLNNDSLWIFDEPQLMANGLTTSAQLAGLRQSLKSIGNCPSIWMSATLESSWLDTFDHSTTSELNTLSIGRHAAGDDLDPEFPLLARMRASKTLEKLNATVSSDMKAVADAVLAAHVSGSQTLVILNTVDRAKATFDAIQKQKKRAGKENVSLLLVLSRFRPAERIKLNQQLQNGDLASDRIIIATQVVEAGVDLSARTLVTELAPWSSLVQRIGRCNRTGNDGPGKVLWVDLNERQAPPYETQDLNFAREHLNALDGKDVSPMSLSDYKAQVGFSLPFEHSHVIRRRDLLDLFDTAPDLSGNDIDIQRYVRGDDPDIDVQVFWRDYNNLVNVAAPRRVELCSVSVGSFKTFSESRDKYPPAVWDHLDEKWRIIRDPKREIRPGQVYLLHSKAGGYSTLGWDPGSTAEVQPLPPDDPQPEEGAGSDTLSATTTPWTITDHTRHVCEELRELLHGLELGVDWTGALHHAARWHDLGKAHPAFQIGLRSRNPTLSIDHYWAKSGGSGTIKHGRRYFRHELASALAAFQQDFPFLVSYLIAAHHGRVRVSIRALPDEDQPASPDTYFALGVHDHDVLPAIELEGAMTRELTLDLSPMRLGGDRSWTANTLKLLHEIGPFRLAYLEMILRAADVRASIKESQS